MKDYLKKHETVNSYETWCDSSNYITPHVAYIEDTEELKYQVYVAPHNYANDYLTIVSLEDNNIISFKAYDYNSSKTINVSTDNGETWTEYTSSDSGTGTVLATLNNGDKLLIKGSNTAYGTDRYYNYFVSTCNFNVEGNIMSLLYGDNFREQTTLDSVGYNFHFLFKNCSKLISAANLILPATILTDYCYYYMFDGCTLLTTVPALPATTLAIYCYRSMFHNCRSLVTAPELPATTLTQHCYEYMFTGCTSLTTAPASLPATILTQHCYDQMFRYCTSLTTAPVISATTLDICCCQSMFDGCTSLTTAPASLPATTLSDYCYCYMFRDCTSLTTAPALPATTLTESCYYGMFQGCSSLTTASELPATTLAIKCYWYMFKGCTSLTTAPALPATTLANNCYQSMFSGCTSLTTAPALPATTLINNCYQYMFYGCTSLNYIKCLATNISATNCLTDWVKNVAASGTFIKANNMASWTTGTSGIPNGWTIQDYVAS